MVQQIDESIRFDAAGAEAFALAAEFEKYVDDGRHRADRGVNGGDLLGTAYHEMLGVRLRALALRLNSKEPAISRCSHRRTSGGALRICSGLRVIPIMRGPPTR